MKDFKIKFRKSAQSRRGMAHITWGRFAAMLRACGYLMEGNHVEAVEVNKKGIFITTDKTGTNKKPKNKNK